MSVEIIILAMLAAFLGLRLYSVLGKRTGHEQEPLPRGMEKPAAPPKAMADPPPQAEDARPNQSSQGFVFDPAAEPGLQQIMSHERNFDISRFVEGAKSAYAMVLDAFWHGRREELRNLCDEDIYDSFSAAIDEREQRGETLENRLVRIEEARIVDAAYEQPYGRITLRFDADIAAVVRNREGELIAGSLTDAVPTHDLWTFARKLGSSDPNWLLVETDEAAAPA